MNAVELAFGLTATSLTRFIRQISSWVMGRFSANTATAQKKRSASFFICKISPESLDTHFLFDPRTAAMVSPVRLFSSMRNTAVLRSSPAVAEHKQNCEQGSQSESF